MPAVKASPIDTFLATHQVVQALSDNSAQILRIINDPDCSIAHLQKAISRDAALAGRLLKAVNSSYYALQTKMTRLDLAIAHMGLRAVKEVALSGCFETMCKPMPLGSYDARDLWDHCIGTAVAARELAAKGKKLDPEEAFLAGILLDLGLLLYAQSEPTWASKILESDASPFLDAETRVLGFHHCELGERLASEWKFSEHLANAIRWHHQPDQAPQHLQLLVTCLFVADTIASQANVGCPLPCAGQQISGDQLGLIGVDEETAKGLATKLKILVRLFLN